MKGEEMKRSQKKLAFSIVEFQERVSRIRNRMKESDISLLLVDTPENITYLTGLETPGYYMYGCAVIPMNQDIRLVLRQAETANALATTSVEKANLVLYDDTQDPIQLVSDVARSLVHEGKIAIEMDSSFMTVNRYQQLRNYLVNIELVDGSPIVLEERKTKSPKEVQKIRKAAQIVSVAMERAVEAVEPGINENEIAGVIFDALTNQGSEFLGMEPFVNSGPRTGTLHASWQGREIQNNESVLIEIGGCVNRYHAALMRTVFLGAVPKELRHWADVTVEALDAAIDGIRPGATAGQVDQACRGVIEKAGLYEKFRKRTGYSIGLAYAPDWGEGHFMNLQKDDPTVLKPGMTFHMPPALREYGKYGFGASETVLVTESGCEVLTKLPNRLLCK